MEEKFKDIPSIQIGELLEVIYEGFILIDGDAKIREVNSTYCKMVGYSRPELLEMTLHDLQPDYQNEFLANAVKKESTGFKTRHRCKDGTMIDLEIRAAKIKREGKTFLAGFVRKQEKEMAAKLKKSEQKWQHLVEDNPHPVQVTIDGEIVFINEAGANLYGAKGSEKLMGMTVFEFSHPDYKEKIEERKHRLENNLPVDNIHEHKIQQINGDSRYVEVNSIPVQYQDKQAIQTVLFDITERKEKEILIEESLKEKEVLLKEIHHRVKNNMAVISGLLELQAMNTSDNGLKSLLKQSQLRISSMAMVHEKLYQTENFSGLGFDEYVRELVKMIEQTVDVPTNKITVQFEMESVGLNINQAIPAALVINEVVVNSYKHAFEDEENGYIRIGIQQSDDMIEIDIEDNGIGLPSDFDIENQNSLGMNLIQTLVSQLEGKISISTEDGTSFNICFRRRN